MPLIARPTFVRCVGLAAGRLGGPSAIASTGMELLTAICADKREPAPLADTFFRGRVLWFVRAQPRGAPPLLAQFVGRSFYSESVGLPMFHPTCERIYCFARFDDMCVVSCSLLELFVCPDGSRTVCAPPACLFSYLSSEPITRELSEQR